MPRKVPLLATSGGHSRLAILGIRDVDMDPATGEDETIPAGSTIYLES